MISIIIPTLNEESVLERTLVGLKGLQPLEYELIISDGRSSDRTAEIARRFTDKVVVYSGEARQTIGGGKNLGAALAQGKYLLFLDADATIPDPENFLDRIAVEFEKDENLLGATVRLRVSEGEATLQDRIFSTIFIDWVHYLCNNILRIGSSSGEFQFVRKESFDKIGGYDETMPLGEDNELSRRLARLGRTKMFYDLKIYHTGRRFHKQGWGAVLYKWNAHNLQRLFGIKSSAKEWKPIR